jgi:hypothetical protein
MRNLFLILITFIIFSCSEENIPSCEENNTYELEVINNTEYFINVSILIWKEEPYFFSNNTIEVGIDPYFVKNVDFMVPGESRIINDLPSGYNIFVYSDGFSNVFICNYYDKLITESCESYILEIKDISIDQ